MMAHLAMAPILLPFIGGVLLLMLAQTNISVQRWIAVVAVLCQVMAAVTLLMVVSDGTILVYRLGDWPAPWGIVLVADRLAAWMVLITTLLALPALVFAGGGVDTQGRHFHVLFQMQLFGLTGAFLTGDLFNLFVFFEVLLIASYGLALHGGGATRTRAGLHYVVMNLAGSSVFLFAAGLIYAALGTLNLADLADKAARLPPDVLGLARTGGLLLLLVFALKAALLPLHLWLPRAYGGTSAPVAALFAIMTKVGIYAILRIHTLVFGPVAGDLTQLFEPWLLPLALVTLVVGALGTLAATSLSRLVGYLLLVSVGTLLIGVSSSTEGIAAALYYLPHSTFTAALMFLLTDAIKRRRLVAGDSFRPDADLPRHALWGALFFAAAVAVVGLPPLSGFIGKFLILRATPSQPGIWVVILLGALTSLIALARVGDSLFLETTSAQSSDVVPTASDTRDLTAMGVLLGLVVAMTVAAGPTLDFAQATARQIADPAHYISAVLTGTVTGTP